MAQSKPKPPTLIKYYPVLSQKDKALIMRALNEWRASVPETSQQYPEVHFGLLPFIGMDKVGFVLAWAYDNLPNKRVWGDVMAKVEASRWYWEPATPNGKTTISLYLNDAKVHKHFGGRPELGVTVPVVPSSWGRGALKWNIAYKAWLPEKIIAPPRISLKRQSHGMWYISMPLRYQQLIETWLRDHCI